VATQDERLRAKFKGKPDNVVAYFNAVAQEMREIMARLGVRNVDQLIGRVEMLRQRPLDHHPKANTIDLSRLLANVAKPGDPAPRYHTRERNAVPNDRPLDDTILQDARDAITKQIPVSLTYPICSTNRAVGTKVSGEIGYQYGEKGLPAGTLHLHFQGTAGQSLGAFLSPGMHITLVGEANDYVGKGMSGGEIVVRPAARRRFDPHENIIVGNTVLYGATGGYFFACGRAGERFCVRNSGCVAVIEGVGDHGCEYMTNGTVVVLGKTGRNFAAGMTGGLAFVYDDAEEFEHLVNRDTVSLVRGMEKAEEGELRNLIESHFEKTGSAFAADLLAHWEGRLGNFWKVVPHPPVASGHGPVVPAESDAALVATPPSEMSA
jgi:glutamate synthase (NADPH/NADH) large chain/glutamate synthase (ferredoxin)